MGNEDIESIIIDNDKDLERQKNILRIDKWCEYYLPTRRMRYA